MKVIFLLPPSEGKKTGGDCLGEHLSFISDKPKAIALSASEKDLKCTGKRYTEAQNLNKQIFSKPLETTSAICRYSGVMYNSISYDSMTDSGKSFFKNNFFILSGMYGILRIDDKISNYKLPIETKGLLKFWRDKITENLSSMEIDYIVNLLPISYSKMIHFDTLEAKVIHINFVEKRDGKIKKISHGVKKIKGDWIKNICESGTFDFRKFPGEIVDNGNSIDINLIY